LYFSIASIASNSINFLILRFNFLFVFLLSFLNYLVSSFDNWLRSIFIENIKVIVLFLGRLIHIWCLSDSILFGIWMHHIWRMLDTWIFVELTFLWWMIFDIDATRRLMMSWSKFLLSLIRDLIINILIVIFLSKCIKYLIFVDWTWLSFTLIKYSNCLKNVLCFRETWANFGFFIIWLKVWNDLRLPSWWSLFFILFN
jgi:hypothetical protein